LLLLLACVHAAAPLPEPVAAVPDEAPAPPDEAAAVVLMEAMAVAYGNGDAVEATRLGRDMVATHPTSQYAPLAQEWLGLLATFGQPAPELAVAEWVRGGPPPPDRPVLLVFFEAWCPHCQQEFSLFQEVHERYPGISVVGVTKMSRDTTPEQLAAFLDERHASFAIAREDEGSLTEAYGIEGIPALVLVDQGRIAWRGHPALLTSTLLDRLAPPAG